MTFTYTLDENGSDGDKLIVRGTFTNATSAGGDISTGLNVVEGFRAQYAVNGIVTDAISVNETLPLINAGGVVTIVTTTDKGGIWEAWGY